VQASYPQASVQLFPSTLSAVGAVAFQQADVYLGDCLAPEPEREDQIAQEGWIWFKR